MLIEHYSDKVKAFLKTVVCFDDELVNEEGSLAKGALIATHFDSGFDEEESPKQDGSQIELKEKSEEVSHPLDFRATANAFAENGILCSVLKPELSGDELAKRIASLANSADVTILDWELEGRQKGRGSVACQNAIKRILEQDKEVGGRLRLIVIFTGTDGRRASEDLRDELSTLGAVLNEKECTLTGSHWRIVVFQKPHTTIPTAKAVSYQDLPGEVVVEFSKLTNGLLPTAVLHGITAIRANTHRLLAIFDRDLDAPFLTHRALIPDPQDAGDFFLEVLQDEIGALMRSSGIKNCVGKDLSVEWIKSIDVKPEVKMASLVKAVSEPSEDKVKDFSIPFEQKDLNKKKVADKVLSALSSKGARSNERLAQLVSLYGAGTPPSVDEQRMQLGVLVFDESKNQYMMCLQPLCDSVRINERTLYPFLILDEVIEGGVKGGPTSKDLFVQVDSNRGVWLQTKLTPKKLVSYTYDPPCGTGCSAWMARKSTEGKSIFEASIGEQTSNLVWIGEVKLGKAQRISSGIASRFHTLGIDEFEWQRLHQK